MKQPHEKIHPSKNIVLLVGDSSSEKNLSHELSVLYDSVASEHGHVVTRLMINDSPAMAANLREAVESAEHLVVIHPMVAGELPLALVRVLHNAWVEHHTHPSRASWWRRMLGLYPRPHSKKTARVITLNSLHPWLAKIYTGSNQTDSIITKTMLEPLGFTTSHTRFGPLDLATLRHQNDWRDTVIYFGKRGE